MAMISSRPWVVTGAAGFLGSHVVDRLLADGRPVLAIDDMSAGREAFLAHHLDNPHFKYLRQDIRDAAELRSIFEAHRPAAVIHLAAVHFIPACAADPPQTVSRNVHGTQCVLSAACAADVGQFWFASTGDVYAPSAAPHGEAAQLAEAFSVYGLSKAMGEQLITRESRERPDARFVIGRLFNLYGPRETNPHFIPEVIGQLKANPTATLRLGNLTPTRDLVPVEDAARAVVATLDAAAPGLTTINVASGYAVSMHEVLDLMGEILGIRLAIETDKAKVRPVERDQLCADVSKLRELIGWAPHADLRRGLKALLSNEMGGRGHLSP